MALFSAVVFWLGIVGLVDGSLGLLFEDRWQRLAGDWPLRKIAFIEIGIAGLLLVLHFWLKFCRL